MFNMNPKAVDLDPRWPLFSVDMVYILERDGVWELKDFFGDAIVRSTNRSVCFFEVMNVGLQLVTRH